MAVSGGDHEEEKEHEEAKADPSPRPRRAVLRVDVLKELFELIRWAHDRRRGWVALTPPDGAGWHVEISILDNETVQNGRIVKESVW